MTVVYDPQIRGAHDDGSNEGVVRTKLSKGDLAAVPFRNAEFVVTSAGTATGALTTSGGVAVEGGGYDHTFLLCTVPALTATSGVVNGQGLKIAFPVYGTAVGLRWQKGYNMPSNAGDFVMAIDGVSYHIVNGDYSPYDNTLLSNIWNESALEVVADDLVDMKHYVELIFPAQGVGGNQNQWVIWGYLGEKRAGYWNTLPLANIDTTGPRAIPTSVASVPQANASARLARAWRAIVFKNTAASATLVSLQYGASNTPYWSALLSAAGTAGDSEVFDFTMPTQIDGQLKWVASQAGANGSLIGVW